MALGRLIRNIDAIWPQGEYEEISWKQRLIGLTCQVPGLSREMNVNSVVGQHVTAERGNAMRAGPYSASHLDLHSPYASLSFSQLGADLDLNDDYRPQQPSLALKFLQSGTSPASHASPSYSRRRPA